jgi:hypothetical protein
MKTRGRPQNRAACFANREYQVVEFLRMGLTALGELAGKRSGDCYKFVLQLTLT